MLPVEIALGFHELPRRPGTARRDEVFWERVLGSIRERPGFASRRFEVRGRWDELHWVLSAERRRGRFWIVDLIERAPPDDLGTWAVRGEDVIPESIGIPDARLRVNRPTSVGAIATWLEQITRADLEPAWNPEAMIAGPFYKGISVQHVGTFSYVCELLDGLASFYRAAAEHEETVLVTVV